MSLLPEVETLKPTTKGGATIIDPNLLISTAKRMINKVIVERENEEYRTRSMLSRWRIPHLLNAVTEDSFHNMVSAALDGQKKTLLNQQPNGRWEPCEHEFDIREGREGMPELFMGIRWYDTSGSEELQYHNGAPVVNVSVKQQAPVTDDRLVEAIKMLAERQIATEDLISMVAAAKTGNDTDTVQNEETVGNDTTPATKKRKIKR